MMLKVFITCSLLFFVLCEGTELQLCDKPVTGQECEMMCHFPSGGSEEMKIIRGSEEIVVCKNSTTCMVKSPDYTDTDTNIHWMSHGEMDMVHFTINKLQIDRDVKEWSCAYGQNVSQKMSLSIYSAPSSCQLIKVPANEMMNASLQCQVNCTYPTKSVSVKLFVNGEESTEMAKKTETENKGCTSTQEKNLEYTWMMEAMEKTEYRCDCSVQAIGWTESDTISMKNMESGMQTTTIVAIVIVVLVVVVAGVIALLLIKKRRNSKGGAHLAREAEGEREEL